jgi:hypothetical protein
MTSSTKASIIMAVVTALCLTFLHVTLSGAAKAGVLDSIMNSDKEEITPTDAYEVDVYGWDARIYEWTPKYKLKVSCVFVASNKSSGVACYEKAVK